MTRDEILALPAGRELDALVAEKVMGWRKKYFRDTAWGKEVQREAQNDPRAVSVFDFNRAIFWYCEEDGREKRKASVRNWKPSTNIAAAWKVVEKMVYILSAPGVRGGERIGKCNLNFVQLRSPDYSSANYRVLFRRDEGSDQVTEESIADTAPLAICRAALLAIAEMDDRE